LVLGEYLKNFIKGFCKSNRKKKFLRKKYKHNADPSAVEATKIS